MRLGIDIDDTTLVTVDGMIKYGDIFCREVLKRKETKSNISDVKDRFYLKALYGWDEETKFKFFDLYYKNILEECYPKEDSVKILNKFKEDNDELFFISSRLTFIAGCDAQKISEDSLTKYEIPFDKIIIGAYSKLEYCLANHIEVFVDDSYDVLEELSKHGIKCYLMTTPMNSSIKVIDSIKRVNTWNEIYNDLKEVNNDSRILTN